MWSWAHLTCSVFYSCFARSEPCERFHFWPLRLDLFCHLFWISFRPFCTSHCERPGFWSRNRLNRGRDGCPWVCSWAILGGSSQMLWVGVYSWERCHSWRHVQFMLGCTRHPASWLKPDVGKGTQCHAKVNGVAGRFG